MAKKLQKDYTKPKKKSNKGVHAKSKSSRNKGSTQYKKKYRGQGKRRWKGCTFLPFGVNIDMDTILQLVQDNPWFGVVTAVVALASAVAAATPTPEKGTFLSKLYSVIDWAALNVGKAKQK